MTMGDDQDSQTLHELFALARVHGEEGEVDEGATHEVGDLQGLCEAMWRLLTPGQRQALMETELVRELRAAYGPDLGEERLGQTR